MADRYCQNIYNKHVKCVLSIHCTSWVLKHLTHKDTCYILVEGIDAIREVEVIEVAVDVDEMVDVPDESDAAVVVDGKLSEAEAEVVDVLV